MQRALRRAERGTTETEARELLDRGEYGILSTCGPDGQPYGVPLSYCLHDNRIYFHCATTGHKLENITADNRVSFCVVGATEVLPDKFATRYESAVVSGRVYEAFGEEKQLALEGLLDKYSSDFRASGLAYIQAKWETTRVFGVTIDAICGKARR